MCILILEQSLPVRGLLLVMCDTSFGLCNTLLKAKNQMDHESKDDDIISHDYVA